MSERVHMALTTAWLAVVLIVLWRRRSSLYPLLRIVPSSIREKASRAFDMSQAPYPVRDILSVCTSVLFFTLLLAVTFS